MYWTEVAATPDGDTTFPGFDKSAWRETAREAIPQGPKDEYGATLVTLERIARI